jgi:hypothetical protein
MRILFLTALMFCLALAQLTPPAGANLTHRANTEEERNKAIQYRKDQSGNIYSFEMVYGPANGEETSKPKLIYRDQEAPNYKGGKK